MGRQASGPYAELGGGGVADGCRRWVGGSVARRGGSGMRICIGSAMIAIAYALVCVERSPGMGPGWLTAAPWVAAVAIACFGVVLAVGVTP